MGYRIPIRPPSLLPSRPSRPIAPPDRFLTEGEMPPIDDQESTWPFFGRPSTFVLALLVWWLLLR